MEGVSTMSKYVIEQPKKIVFNSTAQITDPNHFAIGEIGVDKIEFYIADGNSWFNIYQHGVLRWKVPVSAVCFLEY